MNRPPRPCFINRFSLQTRKICRDRGIRLLYDPLFSGTPGLKDGILLEVGFDRTAPNQPRLITSWAYDRAGHAKDLVVTDNRARNVPCYEPKYTFVEKLQAVIRKHRLYKEGKAGPNLPENFIRHYYDLYQLIGLPEVQAFIATPDYEAFKLERFGGDDPRIANSDAFKLSDAKDRTHFEREYDRSKSLYFKDRPTLQEILDRMSRDLARL